MRVNVFNKFLIFFAASFSGGYKIYSVFIISFLFPLAVVQQFNTYYFVVLLCVSLGVMPLASMMTAKGFHLNAGGKLVWLCLLSVFSCTVLIFFERQLMIDIDLRLAVVLVASVFFMGGYEIARRELANNNGFKQLFVAGVISSLVFLFVFLLYFYDIREPGILIVFLSFCFVFPVLGSMLSQQHGSSFFGGLSLKQFVIHYFSIFLSNSSSSVISFLLPLVLIALLKTDVSPFLGLIFSVANLCMLVPRYISEKNLPTMRSDFDLEVISTEAFRVGLLYFIILSMLSLVFFYLSGLNDFALYYLLFFSLQLTQLTLPYSNVLIVLGRFQTLLKSNLLGLLPFILLLPFVFYDLGGLILSYIFVSIYILSSLVKLYFGFSFCRDIFNLEKK